MRIIWCHTITNSIIISPETKILFLVFRMFWPYFLALVAVVVVVSCQRPSSSYRSDVYIAGFFPYGDGVENAATGKLDGNP